MQTVYSQLCTPFFLVFSPVYNNLYPFPSCLALFLLHLVSCTHRIPTLLLLMTSTISLPLPVIVSTFQFPILSLSTFFFNRSRGVCGTTCWYPRGLPLVTAAGGCTCASPTGNAVALVDFDPWNFFIRLVQGVLCWIPFLTPTPFSRLLRHAEDTMGLFLLSRDPCGIQYDWWSPSKNFPFKHL